MGLGGIISSALGGKGAKKAAAAYQAALGQARNEYNTGYNDIKTMYEPYLTPATQGYNNYVNTINGNMDTFNSSPWGQAYNDYVLNNTINQLQGTAAARGSLQSGNTLKELQENIQSIMTNDYLSRLAQYLGYTGNLGQTALGITNTLGTYRDSLANNLANTYVQGGQAQAAAQTAKYNALGNIFGGLGDLALNGIAGYMTGGATNGLSSGLTSAATNGYSLLPTK